MPYLGNIPAEAFSSFDKQTITGNGGTSYTLDHPVGSAQEVAIFVNNVRQEPGVAYTVTGTALTMTGDVESTDDFYAIFIGKARLTVNPADNTVTAAMLQSDSVTTAKITDANVTTAKVAANAITVPKLASTLDLTSNTVSLGTNPMKPIFWAQKTSDQNLSRATTTKLTGFTTNEIDTNSAFDGTTFTVPTGLGGTYLLQAHIFFDWSNAGYDGEHMYGYIYINGSERARFGISMANGGRHISQASIGTMEFASLSASDTVELYAYIVDDAASGTLRVLGGDEYGCQFGGIRVG